MSIFIIAEAGVNHNGKLELALQLCDAAKAAGADAVKFQTFKTEKLLTRNAKTADYQKASTGSDSQFEMIKQLELSYPQFSDIKRHCDQIGIQFLSTPDEEESLAFLVTLGMGILKIGSAELNNLPFLRLVGAQQHQVIISTGMATLDEVEQAIAVLRSAGTPLSDITALHCNTEYPTPPADVNLRAMLTIKQACGVAIGFSDHTLGIEVPLAAAALGATVIEKHFTLDKQLPGPDHQASLDPSELRAMVKAIRKIELCLGNGSKQPSPSETKNIVITRKSIVAAVPIGKGEPLTAANLTTKRPGNGINPMRWDELIGTIADRDYQADELIKIGPPQ